jgi:uncharacterized protein YjbI with pentapeptide repeats
MATIPPPPPLAVPPIPPTTLVPPADPDAPLRTEKLNLEIEQLKQQNSRGARIVELLKSWGTPLATISTLVALIWTIHAGTVQLSQTQTAQDQDRFDKAITRLGSASVKERQAGAAGLSLFLSKGQERLHGPTLRFLASALVIEDDPTVRSTILDTFQRVDTAIVQPESRDEGLRTLIESDRAIVRELREHIAKINYGDYFALAPHGENYNRIQAVRAVSKGVAILATKGTAIRDFNSIYCAECNFSVSGASTDLMGANFDHAFLDRANFSGAALSGAFFHQTSLLGTIFRGAALRGAQFSGTPGDSYVYQYFSESGERADAPDFACSDLSSADFAGTLFFGVVESNDPKELVASYPDLTGADLTKADLSKISFYALRLRGSKAVGAPFTNPDRSVETYHLRLPFGTYEWLDISPTSDWTFSAKSGPFVNSWRYLLSQLGNAKNVNLASLPVGFTNFERDGYAPFKPGAGATPCRP